MSDHQASSLYGAISFCVAAISALALAPAIIATQIAAMIFDSPGSEHRWTSWLFYIGIWVSPLVLVITAVTGGLAFKSKTRRGMVLTLLWPSGLMAYFSAVILVME